MKTFYFLSKKIPSLLLIIVLIISISSCTTTKKINYFQDLPDSTTISLPLLSEEERIIQKGDRVEIAFGAKDNEAADIFNKYGGIPTSGSEENSSQGNSDLSGYLIESDGKIEFPLIGRVRAEGLTTTQLKQSLTQLVAPYLKEPLVVVKFISFKCTVLGEVRSPGTYNLAMQRTTLFEALGAAGDLPHTAKRYNIQLYRDYNGQRTITRLDLRKKDVLYNSSVFRLKHNDVLIVQPRSGPVFGEDARLFTTLFTFAVGVATLIVTIF